MPELDELIKITHESTELWESGQPQKAFKLLDDAIAEAIRANRSNWVRTLALHAAVLSDFMGDLRLARRYREDCLSQDPDDPMALYGLAKVLSRQGEADLAKEYATKAYKLFMQRGTELDHAMLEGIMKHWPDLPRG
jgi:tetratricopeptide (TPR) repeat protein